MPDPGAKEWVGSVRDLDALLKLANQHAADAVIHTMKPRFRRLCDQQPPPKRVWRSLVLQEKVCARVASRLYNHNRVVHEVAEETTALCCNQGTVHAQLVYAPAPSWVTTVRACMCCCYRQQCASLLCLRDPTVYRIPSNSCSNSFNNSKLPSCPCRSC
jgi:hypothetical protein